MDVTVTDAPERTRYEAHVDGQLAAFVDYVPADDAIALTHTEVLPAFEGKGVSSALVREALDDVRARQSTVRAVCPFVRGWIERHSEDYGDLLHDGSTDGGAERT